MKKLIYGFMMFTAAILLITSCEKAPSDKGGPKPEKSNNLDLSVLVVQPDCGGTLTTDLIAGKTTKVGVVTVTKVGEFINVKYEISGDGWVISETHLSVTSSLAEVPAGGDRNPSPGLFEYSANHFPYVRTYTYTDIPVDGNQKLYILAHAVVKKVTAWVTDLPGISIMLPDYVQMSVNYPYTGAPAYFTTNVTGGTFLDGTYEGWCVDLGNVIYSGTNYTAKVVSTYENDISTMGLVDKPENLEKVNWIINQNFVGQPAYGGGIFTYGDIQRAIWTLVDNEVSTNGLGTWTQAHVDEILAAAEIGGVDFVPACGQRIAVILVPVDSNGNTLNVQVTIAQVTIITIPGACTPVVSYDETAWGAGPDFGGPNWAKYFTYCVSQ